MNNNIINNFIYIFDTNSYFNFIKNIIKFSFCYKIIFLFFLKFNKFKKIKFNKKMYIVKNLFKSVILFYLNLHTLFYFIPGIFNNIWDDSYIRYLGSIYAATDVTGLLNVPNLSITTKLHHYCTFILYTIICYISVNNNNLVKLIVCYTIFSSFAFLVNLYLGLRFFIIENPKNNFQKNFNNIIYINKKLAYYSYLFNLILNWSIHILYFTYCIINNKFILEYMLYILILLPIIKDDLILLNWLKL